MVEASLEVGARVRVLGGPFVGKIGIISELDGKGGARVAFGLLSARVLLADLTPAAGGLRPSLRTSHRKHEPLPGGEKVRKDPNRSKKARPARRAR